MRLDSIFKILFIIYCIEAGLLLLLGPWNVNLWDQQWMHLADPAWRSLILHRITRSAVSGFGAIHVIWGIHDLHAWLFSRPSR